MPAPGLQKKASVTRTLAKRNRFYTTFQDQEHPAKVCTCRTSLETLIRHQALSVLYHSDHLR